MRVPLGAAALAAVICAVASGSGSARAAAPSLVPTASPAPTSVSTGTLQVTKTDPSGQTVTTPGAQFAIHQDSRSGPLVGTIATDGSGSASVNLPPGTYCVEETAAPPGYQLAPTYTPNQCRSVVAGATRTVSVADPQQATALTTGELKVVKTDPNGNVVPVAGAAFAIHQGASAGPVVATITTDGTGAATATRLNPGGYCVQETAAPPGFRLAPTYSPSACVSVVADATQGSRPAVVTVADPPSATPPPTVGELRVVVTDPGGNIVAVAGTAFGVHVGSQGGAVVATLTTDASGTAVAGNLNPATYCVEERTAPDGFDLAPTYSPNACVAVTPDDTQGRLPTTVSVANPPSATPSPAAAAAASGGSSSTGHSGAALQRRGPLGGLLSAAMASLLVVFGMLLMAGGLGLVGVAILRRRSRPVRAPVYPGPGPRRRF